MRHVLSPTPQSRKVRNKVQYSELFFRECGLPRLRTILDCVLSRCVFADYLIRDCALCQCGSGHVFAISWTFFRLRNSAISDAECAISDAFVRDCVLAHCASVAQYVYSLSAEHCFRLRSSAISDERVRYCALCTRSVAWPLYGLLWSRNIFIISKIFITCAE